MSHRMSVSGRCATMFTDASGMKVSSHINLREHATGGMVSLDHPGATVDNPWPTNQNPCTPLLGVLRQQVISHGEHDQNYQAARCGHHGPAQLRPHPQGTVLAPSHCSSAARPLGAARSWPSREVGGTARTTTRLAPVCADRPIPETARCRHLLNSLNGAWRVLVRRGHSTRTSAGEVHRSLARGSVFTRRRQSRPRNVNPAVGPGFESPTKTVVAPVTR
jgi:hypothetical protein